MILSFTHTPKGGGGQLLPFYFAEWVRGGGFNWPWRGPEPA
jgi:hypothetical protein